MAAWTTASAREALRARMGVNTTQLSDTSADAALAAALDEISRAYPYVTSGTLASQTTKRVSVTSLTWRYILAVEVPIDEDPREFQDWEHEEEGTIWMPNYEPATETVRIWFCGTWIVTTLPERWQQAAIDNAIIHAITEQEVQQLIYWSQGGDAAFANAMREVARDARAAWEKEARNLKNAGSVVYSRWGTHRGRLY